MRSIIKAKGSFYDVGLEVGRQTAKDIDFVFGQTVPDLINGTFQGNQARYKEALDAYRCSAIATFAPAIAYAHGLAKGWGHPLDELLGVFFGEELSAGPPAERCSTMCVWTPDGWIVGHQEDYQPVFYGRMLIYDLEIDGYPRTVSLNYPGYLPHLAGSLNEAGVAIVNNALWCPARPGKAKQVNHFEASLQPNALEAMKKVIRPQSALTDHYLIVDAEDRAVSIEVTAEENVKKGSVYANVLPFEGKKGATFVHTNSVERLKLREPDPAPPGSRMRYARLEAIAAEMPPGSLDELEGILSTKDGILRRDEQLNWTLQKNSVTLATVCIAPRQKEIRIARYHPRQLPHLWRVTL